MSNAAAMQGARLAAYAAQQQKKAQKLTVNPPSRTDLQQMGARDGYDVIPAPAAGPAIVSGGGRAAPQPAPITFDDFVKNDFFYNQRLAENERLLSDFDAETLRMQQETEARQQLQRQYLAERLADMGIASAGDQAARGMLRSGSTFQKQDRINQYGAKEENTIAQLLTDLLSERTSGRVAQEQANRAAINQVLQQLASRFNSEQVIA